MNTDLIQSHGTQDIVALMLKNKYDFSSTKVTRVIVVANVGAVIGGTVVGFSSQIFGRRLSIIVMCILGGAALYPYTSTSGPGIYAAFFFEQFFVQGAFGIIPIHLIELSHPAFRTFVVGTSYQLGNLISAASNTIETTIGEQYPLSDKIEDGEVVHRYDYSVVMRVFMAVVFVYIIIITFLGPEELGKDLSIDDQGDETDDDDGENHIPLQDHAEAGNWN